MYLNFIYLFIFFCGSDNGKKLNAHQLKNSIKIRYFDDSLYKIEILEQRKRQEIRLYNEGCKYRLISPERMRRSFSSQFT